MAKASENSFSSTAPTPATVHYSSLSAAHAAMTGKQSNSTGSSSDLERQPVSTGPSRQLPLSSIIRELPPPQLPLSVPAHGANSLPSRQEGDEQSVSTNSSDTNCPHLSVAAHGAHSAPSGQEDGDENTHSPSLQSLSLSVPAHGAHSAQSGQEDEDADLTSTCGPEPEPLPSTCLGSLTS